MCLKSAFSSIVSKLKLDGKHFLCHGLHGLKHQRMLPASQKFISLVFSDYMPRWSIELYSFQLVFWGFTLFPLLSVEHSYHIPRLSIELHSFGFFPPVFSLFSLSWLISVIRVAKDSLVDKINKWIKARYIIQYPLYQ